MQVVRVKKIEKISVSIVNAMFISLTEKWQKLRSINVSNKRNHTYIFLEPISSVY